MIEFLGVHKSFGRQKALSDVSFSIPSGQVVGFLGPNGAGKTTTMRLMVHYLVPDRGVIRIDGKDLPDHTHTVLHRIGYLPETTPLYPEMVVLDYVKMCGRLRGLKGAALHEAIRRMVRLCDLEGFLHKPINTLSKGFRQRTGLAQAMIHDPDILILDEPTTGLDPNQIREILELIRRLGERKTLLLSTHILHHVPDTCDRVLILADGRLVFNGTPDDLASRDQNRNRCFLGVDRDEKEVAALVGEVDFISDCTLMRRSGSHYFYALDGVQNDGQVDQLHRALCTKKWQVCQLTLEPPSMERAFRLLTHGSNTKTSQSQT